jgi:hypothetical protein
MPRHGARISDNDVGSAAIGIAQKCSPAAGTDSPAALLLPRTSGSLASALGWDVSAASGTKAATGSATKTWPELVETSSRRPTARPALGGFRSAA